MNLLLYIKRTQKKKVYNYRATAVLAAVLFRFFSTIIIIVVIIISTIIINQTTVPLLLQCASSLPWHTPLNKL